MQIIEHDRSLAAIDRDAIVAALESGFRSYSEGQVQLSPVGYLDLGGGGDCHIKAALAEAEPFFVVKFVDRKSNRLNSNQSCAYRLTTSVCKTKNILQPHIL